MVELGDRGAGTRCGIALEGPAKGTERERGGGGEREREREREKSNSNSKTLFSKDCSLGSFRPV